MHPRNTQNASIKTHGFPKTDGELWHFLLFFSHPRRVADHRNSNFQTVRFALSVKHDRFRCHTTSVQKVPGPMSLRYRSELTRGLKSPGPNDDKKKKNSMNPILDAKPIVSTLSNEYLLQSVSGKIDETTSSSCENIFPWVRTDHRSKIIGLKNHFEWKLNRNGIAVTGREQFIEIATDSPCWDSVRRIYRFSVKKPNTFSCVHNIRLPKPNESDARTDMRIRLSCVEVNDR